jgi:mono/diheme cytochrome c family protein
LDSWIAFARVCGLKVAFLLLMPFAALAAAPAPTVADRATFEKQVTPFLQQHCVKCHGPEKQKGDVRLDNLPPDFVNNPAAGVWAEVRNKLNLGEMPPKEEARPDSTALAAVTSWVAGEQRAVQRLAVSTGGRVLLRRLSRAEFANTVRDLLDVDFVPGEGPEDLLPPDGRLEGFDKLSKALLLDPSLMDQYFRVAELVASRAVQTRPPAVPSRVARFEFEDTATDGAIRYIAEGRGAVVTTNALILFDAAARTFGRLRHAHSGTQIPVRGEYLVRVRAGVHGGRARAGAHRQGARGRAVERAASI